MSMWVYGAVHFRFVVRIAQPRCHSTAKLWPAMNGLWDSYLPIGSMTTMQPELYACGYMVV